MPVEYLESDDQVGNLQVVVPRKDKMGVSVLERVAVKNLASNPAAIKSFLEGRGYQVRRFGPGMYDFAVRKSADQDWDVVDPDIGGTSLGEFFLDMLDFASDVGIGALSALGVTAGSALGPVGGVAGGGAGAALGEGIRQMIGEAVGMEDNIDPMQIALQGGLGAAVPAAGAALRGGLRAVERAVPPLGRLGRLAGAKIAGIRSTPGMGGEEALDLAASRPSFQGRPRPLATFHEAAGRYRRLVARLGDRRNHPFPERVAVQELVDDPAAPTINLLPITERLRSMILKELTEDVTTTRRVLSNVETRAESQAASRATKMSLKENLLTKDMQPSASATQAKAATSRGGVTARETITTRTAPETSMVPASPRAAMARVGDPQINKFAQELLEDVTSAIEQHGAQEGSVPAKLALELKEAVQQRAFSRGAFREGGMPSKATSRFAAEVARGVRKQMDEAFGGHTSTFSRFMRIVDRKTRALRREQAFIGKNIEQTEKKLTGLYGQGKQSVLRRMERMENLFGIRLKRLRPSNLVREAEAELRIGKGGQGEIIPLITATGQFRSVPVAGLLGAAPGATIGAVMGGPPGAAIGGLIGGGIGAASTFAASPRAIVAATRAANRLAPGMQRALGTALRVQVPTTARAAAAAGLAGIARTAAGKGAARQDRARPKRVIRIGG